MTRRATSKNEIPSFDIDSVDRVLRDNANKHKALQDRYAAMLERLKQDRTSHDEGQQEKTEARRSPQT